MKQGGDIMDEAISNFPVSTPSFDSNEPKKKFVLPSVRSEENFELDKMGLRNIEPVLERQGWNKITGQQALTIGHGKDASSSEPGAVVTVISFSFLDENGWEKIQYFYKEGRQDHPLSEGPLRWRDVYEVGENRKFKVLEAY